MSERMEITVNSSTCCVLSTPEMLAISIIIKLGWDLPSPTPAHTLGQLISGSEHGSQGLLPTVSPAILRRPV